MKWNKLQLTCNQDSLSIIEEILIGYGAISISISDQNKNNKIYESKVDETKFWNRIDIVALFEKKINSKYLYLLLEGIPFSNLEISYLRNQNWVESYQKRNQPKRFGKSLWIYPTWIKCPKDFNGFMIKIDPGMAFGTGLHETTSLCLEYLDFKPPLDKVVIDYGCGSGILGIVSAILGSRNVIAYDNDAQSLSVAKENAEVNKVLNLMEFSHPKNFQLKADLLIANIFSNTLIELKEEFSYLVKPGGRIMLSGILKSQLELVLKEFKFFFNLIEIKNKKDWCLLVMRKKQVKFGL